MSTTRTHAEPVTTHELTEQDWAELDAKYRARYPRECADYRKKFGEEPSLGTLIAAEARRECNNLTEEEEDRLLEHAMSIISLSGRNRTTRG